MAAQSQIWLPNRVCGSSNNQNYWLCQLLLVGEASGASSCQLLVILQMFFVVVQLCRILQIARYYYCLCSLWNWESAQSCYPKEPLKSLLKLVVWHYLVMNFQSWTLTYKNEMMHRLRKVNLLTKLHDSSLSDRISVQTSNFRWNMKNWDFHNGSYSCFC